MDSIVANTVRHAITNSLIFGLMPRFLKLKAGRSEFGDGR
jgi:hypothetical protein